MYCRNCSYSLQGLTEQLCPECGRAFQADSPRTYRQRPYRVPPRLKKFILILAALTPLVSYAGLYYTFVKPDAQITAPIDDSTKGTITVVAKYDFTDADHAKAAETWFAPVHWIDRVVRADCWPTNAPLTLPTIELIQLTTTNPKYPQVTLKMTNDGKHPVWFTGYGMQSPLYTWQNQPAGIGWCGTGLTSNQLLPGKSTTFTAHLPAKYQSERVGVNISHAPQLRAVTVWSKPISADISGN